MYVLMKIDIRVSNEYVPQNANVVYSNVLRSCDSIVEPLFLIHSPFLLSPKRFLHQSHHLWYSQTSVSCDIRYTDNDAHTILGVLLNIVWNDELAQSFSLGVYRSHICVIAIKKIEHMVLMITDLLASFCPWFSLRMSVIRKVLANSTLPRVISIPNARTRRSTSMFASIVDRKSVV